MKEYTADKVRNIALVGHSGAGKTTLTEAALLLGKVTTRMGRVEEGNTVSDFDPEEHRRGISISTSLIPIEWDNHKLNLLDAPGYADFVGEMVSALNAADAAVIVVDSVAGVEVGTEMAWQQCDELGLPRAIVINKMNRDNANWLKVIGELQQTFNAKFVPMQVPIGQAADFKGVYRIVSEAASLGPKGEKGSTPDEVKATADEMRAMVTETAAEASDDLMMKFFDQGLSADEIRLGLVDTAKAGKFVPVFFTSATDGTGVSALLDMLITYSPSPLEAVSRSATRAGSGDAVPLKCDRGGSLASLVFKTQADPYVGRLQYMRLFSGTFSADSRVHNANQGEEERIGPLYVLRGKEQLTVGHLFAGDIGAVAKLQHTQTGDTLGDKATAMTLPAINYPQPLFAAALAPATQADGAKMGQALHKITDEDPTLRSHVEGATHELVLAGMGDTHIDVAVRKLKERYGVSVTTTVPRIPYRETVTKKATSMYRHKKQTGGSGQFAEVHMRVEPRERGAGFEYASEVFGGAISHQFIPSIEKGVRAVMIEGVVANCPVVDVKAIVTDGKEHPVDSKDIAFQIAGREAFKQAIKDAGPALLEPIYNVRVVVPSAQMGDVLGDMNTRRGIVQGTEQQGSKAVVSAQVPLAEIQRYSTDLRSMTQGRGYYTAEFDRFGEVPHSLALQIMGAAAKHQKVED